MQIRELKSRLAGDVIGWYLFCGEENFLKRHYLGELRRAVTPDETLAPFNRISLEGERVDFGALREAVKAPPVMAEKKLVEWHLADFSAMREGDLEKLREAREEGKESPETVVVFLVDADCLDVGTLPKRPSKLYTRLSTLFDVVCFERSGEAALSQWIARHFAHEGVSASPAVVAALLATSGTAMDALSGEITKLVSYVRANGRAEVTEADVAAVASRTERCDAFGLSNAVLSGNAEEAYACLADMQRRRVEPILALAALSRTYADLLSVAAFVGEGTAPREAAACMKMHEYKYGLYARAAAAMGEERLTAAAAACNRLDIRMKTGDSGGYRALMFLVGALMEEEKEDE